MRASKARLGRTGLLLAAVVWAALPVALAIGSAFAAGDANADSGTFLTWSVKHPMPRPGFALELVANAGKIYALGGTGGLAQNVEYDPNTDTWTEKAPMPTGRFSLSAVASQGVVYAIGGNGGGVTALDVVEAYDPVGDTWATVAHLQVARRSAPAVAGPDGRLYVFGGQDAAGNLLTSVEEYAPEQNAWTLRTTMPVARAGFGAALAPDGLIYLIGGRVGGNPVDTVDVYDPTENTWATGTPMTECQFNNKAVVLDDGRIYVLGIGLAKGGQAVSVYDPGSDAWSALSYERPTARDAFGAAAIGRRVYAVGGYSGGGLLPMTPLDVLEVGLLPYPVYLPLAVAGS